MPEGVSPASGVLMTVIREIFIDFSEWMIVKHDNLLVCTHDHDDAYRKLQFVYAMVESLSCGSNIRLRCGRALGSGINDYKISRDICRL
jgi:hypothetical protein